MSVFPVQLDFGHDGSLREKKFIIEKVTGTNLFIGIKDKDKMANECSCLGWVSDIDIDIDTDIFY